MQRGLKYRQNSSKTSVKVFIISTVLGLHLARLQKNVTYPSQVFQKEIV